MHQILHPEYQRLSEHTISYVRAAYIWGGQILLFSNHQIITQMRAQRNNTIITFSTQLLMSTMTQRYS